MLPPLLCLSSEDTAINATAIPEVRVKFFARTTCPSGWTLYSQRCFQFVPLQQTWADAQVIRMDSDCCTGGIDLHAWLSDIFRLTLRISTVETLSDHKGKPCIHTQPG